MFIVYPTFSISFFWKSVPQNTVAPSFRGILIPWGTLSFAACKSHAAILEPIDKGNKGIAYADQNEQADEYCTEASLEGSGHADPLDIREHDGSV